eukprot:GHUV01049444.1.p1 GENE.GHUV01049444.1~~GHUV01049444.1.p1  ORF type:complete len:107 (-),score=5.75 GHUV01049444.1:305-625(-)
MCGTAVLAIAGLAMQYSSHCTSTAATRPHPMTAELTLYQPGLCSRTMLQVPLPEQLQHLPGVDQLQFTLVDCPGHASLIRTIIGGAQIIDTMVLVIDVTKGVAGCC